jgi:hypothetical protein
MSKAVSTYKVSVLPSIMHIVTQVGHHGCPIQASIWIHTVQQVGAIVSIVSIVSIVR